jgi:hypothetical protein
MRQFLNPSNLAATVRMLRSTFPGAFLLVEGECDVRLFNRFIDQVNCRAFFCYGRENLIGIIEILDRDGFAGHVGVVDKDFAEIVAENITTKNIIVTDENDIEVTIFQSDVLERFIAEYCNAGKLAAFLETKGEPLRDLLTRIASVTGALRCLSKLNGWNLSFEDMSFKFNQRRDIEIVLDQQIQHLRGRSPHTTMPHDDDVKTIYTRFRADFPDARQYVRGHDLCEVICKAVHDVFGRAHLALHRSADAVEEVFRVAFSVENFRATDLFLKLRAWEDRNPPYVILSA